jgi:hypothetical protein
VEQCVDRRRGHLVGPAEVDEEPLGTGRDRSLQLGRERTNVIGVDRSPRLDDCEQRLPATRLLAYRCRRFAWGVSSREPATATNVRVNHGDACAAHESSRSPTSKAVNAAARPARKADSLERRTPFALSVELRALRLRLGCLSRLAARSARDLALHGRLPVIVGSRGGGRFPGAALGALADEYKDSQGERGCGCQVLRLRE